MLLEGLSSEASWYNAMIFIPDHKFSMEKLIKFLWLKFYAAKILSLKILWNEKAGIKTRDSYVTKNFGL